MERPPAPDRLSGSMGMLMGLAYTGGGIYLMASSQSFGGLLPTGTFRYLLAVLLIVYGLFRTYRGFQRF